MKFLIGLLIIFFFYKGYSLFVSYLNRDPDKSTRKVYKKSVESKKSFTDSITEQFLLPMTKSIVRLFFCTEENEKRFFKYMINKNTRYELKLKLERAGIDLTPEEYYARPVAMVIMFLPILVLAYITGAGFVVMILLAIAAFALFMRFFTEVNSRLEAKRKEVEKELPGFIRSIVYKLNQDPEGVIKADLISIFEDYSKVGKSIFAYDINCLIMDMKSKDMETAFRAMDARMCIPEVSFLCDALIGITRGEFQGTTLDHLAHDMDIKASQAIEKEIAKRPGKMFVAAIPVFATTMLALVYVLIKYVIDLFYQIM